MLRKNGPVKFGADDRQWWLLWNQHGKHGSDLGAFKLLGREHGPQI